MLASDCSSEKYLAVSDMQGRVINLGSAKLQITDTAVVAVPTAPDAPIKPNVKLNTVMAAILGLFSGSLPLWLAIGGRKAARDK